MDYNKMAAQPNDVELEPVAGMRRTIIPGLVKEEGRKGETQRLDDTKRENTELKDNSAVSEARLRAEEKFSATVEESRNAEPETPVKGELPAELGRRAALTFVPEFQNMRDVAADNVNAAELAERGESLKSLKKDDVETVRAESVLRNANAGKDAAATPSRDGVNAISDDGASEAGADAVSPERALNRERTEFLQDMRRVQPLAPQLAKVDLAASGLAETAAMSREQASTNIDNDTEAAKALAKEREERFRLWEQQTSPKRQPGQTASASRLEQARQATLQRRGLNAAETMTHGGASAPLNNESNDGLVSNAAADLQKTGKLPTSETPAATQAPHADIKQAEAVAAAYREGHTLADMQLEPVVFGDSLRNSFGTGAQVHTASVAEAAHASLPAYEQAPQVAAATEAMATRAPYRHNTVHELPQTQDLPDMDKDYYNNDNNIYNDAYNGNTYESSQAAAPAAYAPDVQNYGGNFDPQQFSAYDASARKQAGSSVYANYADGEYTAYDGHYAAGNVAAGMNADYETAANYNGNTAYNGGIGVADAYGTSPAYGAANAYGSAASYGSAPAYDNNYYGADNYRQDGAYADVAAQNYEQTDASGDMPYSEGGLPYDQNALQIEEAYGDALANDTGLFAALLTSGNDLLQMTKTLFTDLTTKACRAISQQKSMTIVPVSLLYFLCYIIYSTTRVSRNGLLHGVLVQEGADTAVWGNILLAVLAAAVHIILIIVVFFVCDRLSPQRRALLQILNSAGGLLLIQTFALILQFVCSFIWLPLVALIEVLFIAWTALYTVKMINVYNPKANAATVDFLHLLSVPAVLLIPVLLQILF